jgi:phosphoglycerol transferase
MGMHAEQNVVEASDDTGKGLLRYAVSDWKWLTLGALFSFEFASVLLLGWPTGLIPSVRLPYVFAGDGLLVQWLAQRAIEGWIFTNPRSGFPFGSDLYDYPGSDSGSFLIYKILGFLTHSGFSAVDLYFLLSFPIVFAVAFVVLRSFGIRKIYSAMSAVLFTFAPFHFSRLFYGHDLYTWYFGIPLFFYYGKNLFLHGQTHWRLGKPSRLLAFLLVVAALSSFGVYYAFFGVIVLIVSGIAASAKARAFRPLFNASLFCVAIGSGVILNVLPNIIDRASHGVNTEVAVRMPSESEFFALKIMQLVLPQPNHRIEVLQSYAKKYDATFPLANTTASLGGVGTVGFLALLLAAAAALIGTPVKPRFGFVAVVVISLLLISTVGGFNVLFATLVTPLIRGWDRISIFIEFGAILGFSLLIDGCNRINGSARATGLIAAGIATIGLLDQTPVSYFPTVASAFATAPVDESFIHQIEASVPKGAAIYQLPYMAFPESAPTEQLTVYELGTGFINSKTLRWSFGGMQGRQGDLFFRSLAKETVAKQLDVIKKLGFSGVYIDKRGFADRGAALIGELGQLLGSQPLLERSDGNVVFFKIADHGDEVPVGVSPQQVMSRTGYFADQFGVRSDGALVDGIDFSASARIPSFVSDMSGLSVAEPWGRWSDANLAKSVVVTFASPLPDRFTMVLSGVSFGPNTGKTLTVVIGSIRKQIEMPAQFDMRIPVELKGERVSSIEFVPPVPTSPKEFGMAGADTRKLGVGFKSLKIE